MTVRKPLVVRVSKKPHIPVQHRCRKSGRPGVTYIVRHNEIEMRLSEPPKSEKP